jgi:anti-anti-sigma factor
VKEKIGKGKKEPISDEDLSRKKTYWSKRGFVFITAKELFGETISLGNGAGVLKKVVDREIGNGKFKFCIDLTDVKYMDQSGLAQLLASAAVCIKKGGGISLFNPNQKIQDNLVTSNTFKTLNVVDDLTGSIRLLNAKPKK